MQGSDTAWRDVLLSFNVETGRYYISRDQLVGKQIGVSYYVPASSLNSLGESERALEHEHLPYISTQITESHPWSVPLSSKKVRRLDVCGALFEEKIVTVRICEKGRKKLTRANYLSLYPCGRRRGDDE